MDTKIEQLIEYVRGSDLDEEDKSFLLSKLNDENLPLDEKEKSISELLTARKTEIDGRSRESAAALSEAEEEIVKAEEEYNETMAELDKEAEALSKSLGEEMNSVVPEE